MRSTAEPISPRTGRTRPRRHYSAIYRNRLPERWVWNFNVGARLNFGMIKGTASIQVLNLFDNEYLEDADRFGVIPGLTRAIRFNMGLGI